MERKLVLLLTWFDGFRTPSPTGAHLPPSAATLEPKEREVVVTPTPLGPSFSWNMSLPAATNSPCGPLKNLYCNESKEEFQQESEGGGRQAGRRGWGGGRQERRLPKEVWLVTLEFSRLVQDSFVTLSAVSLQSVGSVHRSLSNVLKLQSEDVTLPLHFGFIELFITRLPAEPFQPIQSFECNQVNKCIQKLKTKENKFQTLEMNKKKWFN